MTEISGSQLMQRLRTLSQLSESDTGLTRTYLTREHRRAGEVIQDWMREAGMTAEFDAAGNVCGRYEGDQPGLPALLIGSHYDTVRNAGIYDGMYGVLAGIACVDALNRAGERLPFAVEVIAFGDEEGVRFDATLIGSRAVAGTLEPAVLQREDAAGISLEQALKDYGLVPSKILDMARKPEELHAYIELHIEQGPVLETRNLPVGIVTAIAGANRFNVTISGQAGHAGTVPMSLRHDAACAAAEVTLCVEALCKQSPDLVGTVGKLQVVDGAMNVIPGKVDMTIDIRAGSDEDRASAIALLRQQIDLISDKRGVSITLESCHEADAAVCAPWLIEQLSAAIARNNHEPLMLISGAGHDAMSLPAVTDIVMMFVRCGNGGISHHPDEIMTETDAVAATTILLDFVRAFSPVSVAVSGDSALA